MFKKGLIAAIGKTNYIHYVTFITDLYQSACVPFKAPGTEIIKRYLIPRGGTVVDIGANAGRFTAFAAPLVGRSGRVYCFEPVPAAWRVLKKTVALRRLRQVVVIEAALSNRTGTAVMTIPLKDGWKPQLPIAYLGGHPQPEAWQETVPVEQLDEFCAAHHIDRIDFIKCDTEGHEYFVFAGGLKTLERDRPSIFCEIAKPYLARHQLDPAAVFELLATLGYQAYLPTAQGKLTPVEGYCEATDYFFLHPLKLKPQLRQMILETENSHH
jgi:FkbM family methyltransferase